MQEHVIVAKRSRIFHQSIFIWLFAALQISFTLYAMYKGLNSSRIGALLFINVILGAVTVPGIFLFFRYYKHSAGKKFVITYNYLRFIDERTGTMTELKNTDIEKILLVVNPKISRLPWAFHEYFAFIDNKQNKIIITSYFMNIGYFWLDTLTRRIDSDKLVRVEKVYPIF